MRGHVALSEQVSQICSNFGVRFVTNYDFVIPSYLNEIAVASFFIQWESDDRVVQFCVAQEV